MKIEGKTLALLVFLVFLAFLKGGDTPSPPPSDVLVAKQAGEAYLSGLADALESYDEPATEREAYEQIDEIFNRVGKQSFRPINQRMDDMEYSPEQLDRLTKNVAKGLREAVK